jgi:hypothetical protein
LLRDKVQRLISLNTSLNIDITKTVRHHLSSAWHLSLAIVRSDSLPRIKIDGRLDHCPNCASAARKGALEI